MANKHIIYKSNQYTLHVVLYIPSSVVVVVVGVAIRGGNTMMSLLHHGIIIIISPIIRGSPSGGSPIVKNNTIVTMPTIDMTTTPNIRAVNPHTCLDDHPMMSQ